MRLPALLIVLATGCQGLFGISDTTRGQADAAVADAAPVAAADAAPADAGIAFSVQLVPSFPKVVRGASVDLPVILMAPAGFDREVTVSLAQLPPGVTATTTTVTRTTTSKVTISAGASAPFLGRATVTLNGAVNGRVEQSRAVDILVADPPLSLDLSFNETGIVSGLSANPSDQAAAVLVQPDDSILVGFSSSGFRVVRLLPDGKRDGNFGDAGTAKGGDGALVALALQSNGSIIAAGTRGNQMTAQRFFRSGAFDDLFGVGGAAQLSTDTAAASRAAAVVVETVGERVDRIIVAGNGEYLGGAPQGLVCGFLADGAVDPSFSATTGCFAAGQRSVLSAIALGGDESLFPAGRIDLSGSGNQLYYIDKLTPKGGYDSSFGGGSVSFDAGGSGANGVALHLGTGVVVVGSTGAPATSRWLVGRVALLGQLDDNFASHGIIAQTFGGAQSSLGFAVVVDPAGNIIIVGSATDLGGVGYGGVQVLDSAGQRVLSSLVETLHPRFVAAALDREGRLVTAGGSSDGVTVMRMWL